MTKADNNTKTYLIKDTSTGFIKIGKSKNPKNRLKVLSLANMNLELVHVFDFNIENYLHREFKNNSVGGEWFNVSAEEVISLVSSRVDIENEALTDKKPMDAAAVVDTVFKVFLSDRKSTNSSYLADEAVMFCSFDYLEKGYVDIELIESLVNIILGLESRERLKDIDLQKIEILDTIASQSIKEFNDLNLPSGDVNKLCKERVSSIASVLLN